MIDEQTRALLARLAERYETTEFIVGDPSWWMHQVSGSRNQEATAFVASGLSYGSRSQFMPKIGQLLEWADGDMDRWLREGGYRRHFVEGGKDCFYRLYNEGTMRAFLDAYRAMLVECGSMGDYLSSFNSSFYTPHSSFHDVEAICRWFAVHGSSAVVPKDATSACKRVCMFLRWDEAGNLGQVSIAKLGDMFETGRFLFWTEDSRMHTAVDDKYYSYYAYDYGGERRLKLVGVNSSVDVNAEYMTAVSTLNEPTLYPSAYMVLTNKGYTKHYYAGTDLCASREQSQACLSYAETKQSVRSNRVAARLGGGGLNALYYVIGNNDTLQGKADSLFDQSLEQVNNRILYENDLDCIMSNEFAIEEFGHWIDGIPNYMQADVEFDHSQFRDVIYTMLDDPNGGMEMEVYFYHSDHLGSASWKKERFGKPFASERAEEARSGILHITTTYVQHLQYLPYGEPYVNQHPFGYSERFTFTGKERDEETGFGYFGARYMDHELMTMWLSVDPMADKYPSISPYAYCAWNPVKLVDPDGREIDDYYNLKGELIRHTNEGNNLYLVITEGTEVIEDRTIVVPTNATLGKIKSIYSYNNQLNEKGIAVESDGSCAGMATGSKTHISKAQWKPVFDDINKRGAKVDFLVHLHPADFAHLDIGDRNPSDLDRQHSNFYNSKLGAILSFVQPFDFNRTGQSTNSRDYIKYISFYNETSENYIHTMKFNEFERLIKDINEKSGRQ